METNEVKPTEEDNLTFKSAYKSNNDNNFVVNDKRKTVTGIPKIDLLSKNDDF